MILIAILVKNWFLLLKKLTCKVTKITKIRNQYNQVPHLIHHIIWERDKTQENITHKIAKKVSPLTTGDTMAASNRQYSIITVNVKSK